MANEKGSTIDDRNEEIKKGKYNRFPSFNPLSLNADQHPISP